MRITIKQIAERSGVSEPTVSRVLSNSPRFQPAAKTRERVLRAAEELGYRPNSSARAISTGRFGSLALLLSTQRHVSTLPPELLAGIYASVHARNLHLMVAQLPDQELTNVDFGPKVLREWAVDGLLINYTHHIPDQMLTHLQEHSLPAVWINSKQETSCVYPNDYQAAHRATERLIELGHRNIVYVSDRSVYGPLEHYSARDRKAGYEAAMQAAGLTPHCFLEDIWAKPEDGIERKREVLLTSPERPTALVGYSAPALQPLAHSAAAMGLEVPRTLALVVIDSKAYRDWLLHASYATWILPNYEIGRIAVEMLLDKIDRPEQPPPCRPVPLVFEPHDTFLPPASR